MRIAIVSDIHGNQTAFRAVLEDLRETSPDMILHGGDIADAGSGPVEIVDAIRDLGWQGVAGNTDQLLGLPDTFEQFAAQAPHLHSLWTAIREIAFATRELLGEERLAWLRDLPLVQVYGSVALVHASPGDPWRAPARDAGPKEFESAFASLAHPIVVYGHLHSPFVRTFDRITVANSGSVGLPHDGDPRASYLLIDDATPQIRRVSYDVSKEIAARRASAIPHADWIARTLESARPQMP